MISAKPLKKAKEDEFKLIRKQIVRYNLGAYYTDYTDLKKYPCNLRNTRLK